MRGTCQRNRVFSRCLAALSRILPFHMARSTSCVRAGGHRRDAGAGIYLGFADENTLIRTCRLGRNDKIVEADDAFVGTEASTSRNERQRIGIADKRCLHIIEVATDIRPLHLHFHVVGFGEVYGMTDGHQWLPSKVMFPQGDSGAAGQEDIALKEVCAQRRTVIGSPSTGIGRTEEDAAIGVS